MDLNHPLLAAGLDDPLPFSATYPQLRRLDRAVVCQICKEAFVGPVSIACGHSFCSQCIRSSLDVMKRCPTCNEPVGEGSIRRNRALEEITEAWDESRPTLITLSQPPPVNRKRPPPEPNSKASSSSGRLKRPRHGSASRSQSPAKAAGSELDWLDYDGIEAVNEDGEPIEELTENDEAPCPICGAKLPIASIPMHIERGCPPPKAATANVSGNQKADWKKVFAGAGIGKGKEVEMKRITKPNYALSTPAELRGILSEYGLPTVGDKSTLEARVQEWIILWNSNLDTSHPRSISALRARLNEAEASRKRDKERGKDNLGQQLSTKEGMEKYARDKKSEFERLRREIMERKKRRAESKKGSAANTAIEVD